MRIRFWSIVLAALAVYGCGDDDDSSARAKDAGSDATSDATTPPPPVEAGARIRSVETRNPFGTVAEHNLLVDGDFELTSSNGQFGWQSIAGGTQGTLGRETGGLCRSGVTCGIIEPQVDLLGWGAAPRDKAIEISVWTKPPVADCGVTVVNLINCMTIFLNPIAPVPPTSAEPDTQGWCHHHVITPPIEYRPCLYVVSYADSGTKTLIDQASLLAADGSGSSSIAAGPPSPELHARISRALRVVHERMRFGRPEPSRP